MMPSTIPFSGKRTLTGASSACSSSSRAPPAKKQRTSPVSVLRTIFGKADNENSPPKSFSKPSGEEIDAYDLDAVRAIRSGDLTKLKHLHMAGKNLNAANQFGESLLHMTCRRGNLAILSFMLREAKVRVDIRDDFGRNPLHDACWTTTPNFEVMDELIEHVDPDMFLSEDVRGSTPFDYVRSNHWEEWVKYLSERKERLQQRIREVKESPSSSNTESPRADN
jgi:ankyrin repeat protein